MPLLPPSAFNPLFSPLQGKRIGFFQLPGNAGDNLIHAATLQLFRHFDIEVQKINDTDLDVNDTKPDFDEIVVSGGANIGSLYPECAEKRKLVLALGLPTTIFPQSFTSDDEDITPYRQVYVRENTSLQVGPTLKLAPDLALGYEDVNTLMPPEFETGLFLREDVERIVHNDNRSICDPASICWKPADYLNLASQFAHIYTDRLHFAIAALITGRQATLLPNSYYKNRAMHETWLADLGCQWLDDLSNINYDKNAVIEKLWPRLAGVPDWGPGWASVPDHETGDKWHLENDQILLKDVEGNERVKGDENTQMIWSLCDGQRDIQSIAHLIGDAYPNQQVEIARDVRSTLSEMHKSGAIVLNRGDSIRKRPIRLEQMDDFSRNGWHYRQARLIHPNKPEKLLWFSVPDEHATCIGHRMDSFVVATLMEAMYCGRPLRVSGGKISASLAEHLHIFQDVWHAWRTDYEAINLDVELDSGTDVTTTLPPLLAFSGGLDSAYSAWQLKQDPYIDDFSALMVHGLDIPLSDEKGFKRALSRSRKMLESLDVEVIPMRTNFRAVHGDQHWEYRHATAIAGALALLQSKFGSGIISSTLPNTMQSFWGSNPTTDPLLGSRSFPINHYGDEATRLEKFRQLINWQGGLDHLRVCWQGREHDRNCGHCNKCLTTRLSLLVLGLGQNCYDDTMSADEIIAELPDTFRGRMANNDIKDLIIEARKRFPGASWLKKMEKRYTYVFNIKSW